MNTSIYEDKCTGAFIAAAIGDALGWPNEMRSQNLSRKQVQSNFFVKWTRHSGGRYWYHDEIIQPGEYSDDTQMILAVARSLLQGEKWNVHLIRAEFPYWLQYERGGGNALKNAAKCWRDRKYAPWDQKNDPASVRSYFSAGGNGAAMRILPHVVVGMNRSVDQLMNDVIRNGMYTHGHPRALLGATCYAYSLWFLAQKQGRLEYGELIDSVISGKDVWGKFHNVLDEWVNIAAQSLQRDYLTLWNECVEKIVTNLHTIRRSIKKGLLDVGNDVLTEIGCFDKNINGAGDIATISALYFASKYASNPKLGVKEAASMYGTDTDTVASMTGGLLGMIHGTQWIPSEWRSIQDYEYLCRIPLSLISANMTDPNKRSHALIDNSTKKNEWINTPIGKVCYTETWTNKQTKTSRISTIKAITEWGQTLFIKQFDRINENGNSQVPREYAQTSLTTAAESCGTLKFDLKTIMQLLQNPIQKITFMRVLQIAERIISGQENCTQIASELNTQEEYVQIIKSCISKSGV